MRELEPLVAEFQRLEAAAAALDGLRGPSAPSAPSRKPRPRRRAARATSPTTRAKKLARRAPRGARVAETLAFLKERPGLPASEVAKGISASRTQVHALLRRLEGEGKAVKRGQLWYPKSP